MAGGLLIFSGVIATSFATSVNQIYVTYGLLTGTQLPAFISLCLFQLFSFFSNFRLNKNRHLCTGMGYCLTFLPTVTILSQYFTRRRALVTAVASTGESLFMSALAPGECMMGQLSCEIFFKSRCGTFLSLKFLYCQNRKIITDLFGNIYFGYSGFCVDIITSLMSDWYIYFVTIGTC